LDPVPGKKKRKKGTDPGPESEWPARAKAARVLPRGRMHSEKKKKKSLTVKRSRGPQVENPRREGKREKGDRGSLLRSRFLLRKEGLRQRKISLKKGRSS